jgi:hypothetical protein
MNDLPDGADTFLADAGWGDARAEALTGDASFRRYWRLTRSDESTLLMHAPPPQEDVRPFVRADRWLRDQGLRAPEIHAEDETRGFVLLEDFGAARMRDYLDEWPQDEADTYRGAIDALVELHRKPAGPFADYSWSEYAREVRLFTEWYCPARGLTVDADGYIDAWQEALLPVLRNQREGVTVLRDYHAENIMLLGALTRQGLLDFQDALVGHKAYDLVSLLQDARRDVAPELEREMLDYYLSKADPGDAFEADYARLGAQRNAKIVGIFTRLWKRDGKERYLDLVPRVLALLERDLEHPALAPVAKWFDANIPQSLREGDSGSFDL